MEDLDSESQCLYDVLGLQKTCTQAEIKAKYRELALKYHPDKNPDNPEAAEEQFKKIKEAYDILGDETKRSFYDGLCAMKLFLNVLMRNATANDVEENSHVSSGSNANESEGDGISLCCKIWLVIGCIFTCGCFCCGCCCNFCCGKCDPERDSFSSSDDSSAPILRPPTTAIA